MPFQINTIGFKMNRLQTLLAASAALFAFPALAHDGVHIADQYARTNGGIGATGAIFLSVENHADVDDRLVNAVSDIAEKVEIHTHIMDANGVMQMTAVPEGLPILPQGALSLERGGDHIMLMGLKRDLKDGDTFQVTLNFEHAGAVLVDVTIDNTRKPGKAAHDHKAMGAAAQGHDAKAGHDAHAGQGAAMVDTTGMADPEAITAILKAQFDMPESPLSVDPIVVEGDHALASWAQGDKGGRALLERRDTMWTVVLCGGPDLRLPAFLAEHGVSAAETLSKLYNSAEDGLGADKVALSSSFEGVVMISKPASE
jgi:copper(I)-binding protein